MAIGKVFGINYYYDCFVNKLDSESIRKFIDYDQADVDITDELLPENALEWCHIQFGKPGRLLPNCRWYIHEGSVWFLDEQDFMLWTLRWG